MLYSFPQQHQACGIYIYCTFNIRSPHFLNADNLSVNSGLERSTVFLSKDTFLVDTAQHMAHSSSVTNSIWMLQSMASTCNPAHTTSAVESPFTVMPARPFSKDSSMETPPLIRRDSCRCSFSPKCWMKLLRITTVSEERKRRPLSHRSASRVVSSEGPIKLICGVRALSPWKSSLCSNAG